MPNIKKKFSSMNSLLRGVLLFLGGVLILLIFLQLLITLFADDYAANYLKDRVNNSSNSAYTIQFDDLDLSLFRGSATISNVRLNADTAAFSDTATSRPPKQLFEGTLGEVDISGVNVLSALWGDALSIGTITLNNADVSIRRNPHQLSPDTTGGSASIDSTIYTAISKRYKALEVSEIDVNESSITHAERSDTLGGIGRLNINFRNIRVDSASARSGRRFITDDLAIEAESFHMKLPDSLNTVRFKALTVSSDNQHIAFDSLQLDPRYPRFEYSQQNGYRSDRLDLTIPALDIRGFKFDTYVDSGYVRASFIEIANFRLVDFLNKGFRGGPPKVKRLPITSFQETSQRIKIDSLKIRNGYIAYSEYLGKAPQAGTVTFEQLDASMYSISNYPDDMAQGITTTLDVRTRVMGSGMLNVHFEFPMDTGNAFHRIRGSLDRMPMTDFNRMLQYAAFVRLDSGTLYGMDFSMRLDNNRATGDLTMQYENLEISVLDKSSIQQKGLLPNLMTFVANNFIVRENNMPEGSMKSGLIQFDRVNTKSVFNYWWKSLLSGIKDTIKR